MDRAVRELLDHLTDDPPLGHGMGIVIGPPENLHQHLHAEEDA